MSEVEKPIVPKGALVPNRILIQDGKYYADDEQGRKLMTEDRLRKLKKNPPIVDYKPIKIPGNLE
ncbi:MAG: hypothetical protein N2558_04440 [Patescibacteria group bacterium]|nr:hypothetical protein [Patescibacteria group bacterium]